MTSQSIPQSRRMPHQIIDLLLHYWETDPRLIEEYRQADEETRGQQEAMLLRALNGMLERGAIDQAEYDLRYAALRAQHGTPCACGRGALTYTHTDGRRMCGACALEVLGVRDALA